MSLTPSIFCDCERGQIAKQIRLKRIGGWDQFQRSTAAANALAAKQHRNSLFTDADVPVRFRELDIQTFARKFSGDPGKRQAISCAMHFYTHGKIPKEKPGQFYYGLYLYGDFGVGKTSLLAPIFTKLAAALGGGLWLPFLSFMNQVKDGYNDNTAQQKIDQAKRTPVLMIEDFGSVARDTETAHTIDVIWQIVYHRNGNNLPTLITSNMADDDAAVHFNDGIMQRVKESLKVIHVGGKIIREG